MTGRADLTDAQWAILELLLPVGKKPGRPPAWTKRQFLYGIRWRVRVGSSWRDVPPACGCWQTVYGLFRRWQRAGVWAVSLAGCVDFTINRAHQHAAGARATAIGRRNRRAVWASPNRPITRWAGRGVDGRPSCTWLPSKARNH
ncbi:transposase [Amycolatopsis vancoresmycina]|uniref:Transposase n=1 Tax=Amycolatopsis vancoresmycina DSM 44592 TaxID=1292037 RepID=R1I3T7_9PSEU|nr:transposase [Amycolatopsis vancoresmycina]EOD67176.1 transposase [Amycolatopsis vancoresmycina DSM 44592]